MKESWETPNSEAQAKMGQRLRLRLRWHRGALCPQVQMWVLPQTAPSVAFLLFLPAFASNWKPEDGPTGSGLPERSSHWAGGSVCVGGVHQATVPRLASRVQRHGESVLREGPDRYRIWGAQGKGGSLFRNHPEFQGSSSRASSQEQRRTCMASPGSGA